MIKLILFDFDGTIADTLNAGLKIYNMNAEDQGFKKVLNLEEAKKLSMSEFMQQFKIPIYKVPFLMRRVHALLNKDIHKMKMFKGMKTVVKELNKDFSLGILSSNAEKNILKFLKSKKLENQFEFVMSYPSLFGKGSAIKKICKIRGIKTDEVLYIGDEVRDIIPTKKIGTKMMSVTWGYNAKERLIKEKPDWIVDKPSEILKIAKNSK